jgi:hypothetical protein
MAAATTNIFFMAVVGEEIISVLRFFLPSRRHSSAAMNFLNVLRESAAKFA